jgi:hypothetical protein
MATKTKSIAGHAFELSWPYAAGHVLTEAEAKALNQVRSENIGNNVRTKVQELIEAGDVASAQAYVAERDAEYVFSFSTGGGGGTRKMDPIEREARAIAKDIIKNVLAEQGRKLSTIPEGMTKEEWEAKLEENIEMVATKEEVLKAARKRVTEKAKTASSIAEGLQL